jgi:hypothetical protein
MFGAVVIALCWNWGLGATGCLSPTSVRRLGSWKQPLPVLWRRIFSVIEVPQQGRVWGRGTDGALGRGRRSLLRLRHSI